MNKKFKEPLNTSVSTTRFVLEDKKDITIVFHLEDNYWSFTSNDRDDNWQENERIVELEEIISIDETVLQIADLKEGWGAQRKFKNDPWRIALLPE